MGDKENRLKRLKEANELIDKAKKAVKDTDKDALFDLLEKIQKKKWEFNDAMPKVLGHPFMDWYWDLHQIDRIIDFVSNHLRDREPGWDWIKEYVGALETWKKRIEEMLKG